MNKYTKYILKLKNSTIHIEAAKRAKYQLDNNIISLSGKVSAALYQIVKVISKKFKSGIFDKDLIDTINELASIDQDKILNEVNI